MQFGPQSHKPDFRNQSDYSAALPETSAYNAEWTPPDHGQKLKTTFFTSDENRWYIWLPLVVIGGLLSVTTFLIYTFFQTAFWMPTISLLCFLLGAFFLLLGIAFTPLRTPFKFALACSYGMMMSAMLFTFGNMQAMVIGFMFVLFTGIGLIAFLIEGLNPPKQEKKDQKK